MRSTMFYGLAEACVEGHTLLPHVALFIGFTTLSLCVFTAGAQRRVDEDGSFNQAGKPNAKTLVVVQEGLGRVITFDAMDPTQKTDIFVGAKPHEVEIASDGKTAFVSNFGLLEVNHHVGTPGTTIAVLDIQRNMKIKELTLPIGTTAPHGVKLRPGHGEELFTNTEEGQHEMVVFNTHSGRLLRSFPLPPGVHNFIFNSDGSLVFAFTTTNKIFRIDPRRGTITGETAINSPRGIAWNADQSRLLIGGKDELICVDPEKMRVIERWSGLGVGQIFYPSATPDGRWILAPAVLDGTVLVLNASTGMVEHRLHTGSPLQAVINGEVAWVSNVLVPASMLPPDSSPRKGGVTRIDLLTFETTEIPNTQDANGIAVSR